MPSTTRYKRGDIVLVPFPFTDLSSSKRRPALVISPDPFSNQVREVVVAAMTSQLTDNRRAVAIEQQDCVDGILPKPSKPALHTTIQRTNEQRRASSEAAKWEQDLAELRKNLPQGHKKGHTLIQSGFRREAGKTATPPTINRLGA